MGSTFWVAHAGSVYTYQYAVLTTCETNPGCSVGKRPESHMVPLHVAHSPGAHLSSTSRRSRVNEKVCSILVHSTSTQRRSSRVRSGGLSPIAKAVAFVSRLSCLSMSTPSSAAATLRQLLNSGIMHNRVSIMRWTLSSHLFACRAGGTRTALSRGTRDRAILHISRHSIQLIMTV